MKEHGIQIQITVGEKGSFRLKYGYVINIWESGQEFLSFQQTVTMDGEPDYDYNKTSVSFSDIKKNLQEAWHEDNITIHMTSREKDDSNGAS